MPSVRLRAAWAWNYRLAEHQGRNPDCFVPTIKFLLQQASNGYSRIRVTIIDTLRLLA
jgi:hypothetical protein